MEITEKVAYLKGLMEGMKIDTETNEGKILSAMVDILEDIGLELEDLWNAQGELEDGLDVVSDDLEDIEDIVYDEESFDDEYYEDDAEEDEDCYATTCPTCEETIYFDESVLEDGEVICPNCGEKLEFDMSSLEEDSDDDQE
ncbi:CD1247 N-terminal domain-containing protein [Dysosmobacter sp.]|uniref:CD1247 N-terminal domain-containing protein n=1 Tax=Dysosmobacter sp. TaxID=2591382 RepID=UPI002F934C6F